MTYGILVPRPGIEPVPPAVEAQSPNHWTAREFPLLPSFNIPLNPLMKSWLHDCDNKKEKIEDQLSPSDYMKIIHFFNTKPPIYCGRNERLV